MHGAHFYTSNHLPLECTENPPHNKISNSCPFISFLYKLILASAYSRCSSLHTAVADASSPSEQATTGVVGLWRVVVPCSRPLGATGDSTNSIANTTAWFTKWRAIENLPRTRKVSQAGNLRSIRLLHKRCCCSKHKQPAGHCSHLEFQLSTLSMHQHHQLCVYIREVTNVCIWRAVYQCLELVCDWSGDKSKQMFLEFINTPVLHIPSSS